MPLTGDELKAKLAELGQVDEAAAALACGYVTKNGKASLASFRQAQLEAHGLALSKPKGAGGRKGRALSFNVTTSAKGNIVLSGGYSSLIGIEPGEQVQIAHQGDALILTKAGVTATATATAAPVVITDSQPVVTYDSAPVATPEPALTPF